jgi:hypothetical protein
MSFRDRRGYRLTRHFFDGLFDLGFLSADGSMSFTKVVIGVCALFFTCGLLMLRIYAFKYVSLSGAPTAEPYLRAMMADHAFLMAFPMWILAFVTVLIGHALFPDETDFRVLMSLPITRRLVFGAKLLALVVFTGLFAVSIQIAFTPLFILTSVGRWAEGAFVARAGAYYLSSALASAWAVLAVVAIHGLLLLLVPRHRAAGVSSAVRSVILCGLVLLLPLLFRLPATGRAFSNGAWWLVFVPPAWFVGLEQRLLGREPTGLLHFFAIAGAMFALAGGVAAASYAALYRHFDRVMLRTGSPDSSRRGWLAAFTARTGTPRRTYFGMPQAFVGIRAFTLLTLRRSVLHQGIVVVLSAIGLGFVVNSVVNSNVLPTILGGGPPPRSVIGSVIWTPYALMFVMARAVRMALVVPIEPRANWIFRMTESGASRANQLGAAMHVLLVVGVLVPILVLLPLQFLVIGASAVSVAIFSALMGWLYAELLMQAWTRIPFTCSYIPGKAFVPQTVLLGIFTFAAFTGLGVMFGYQAMRPGVGILVVSAVIVAAAAGLRHWRRKNWHDLPLEFEDVLPSEINPLRLGP